MKYSYVFLIIALGIIVLLSGCVSSYSKENILNTDLSEIEKEDAYSMCNWAANNCTDIPALKIEYKNVCYQYNYYSGETDGKEALLNIAKNFCK